MKKSFSKGNRSHHVPILPAGFALLPAITLAAGLLSACGSTSSATALVAETTAYDMAWEEGANRSPAAFQTETAAGAANMKDAFIEEAAEMEAPAMDTGGSPADTSPIANLQNAHRKLIRTVGLNVETTDFDTLLENIRQSVEKNGGYIEQSDVSGTSISQEYTQKRYAYMTVRIPSDHLDGFLSQMDEQSNVTNRSENVQDVTLQYTDIESRKKSLTIEQERLWDLLEKADTLESVIALESRLSEIRYQLESFESQLRTYDNQVDYSTVNINIYEVGVFTPTEPDSIATRIQKGFARNLKEVENGLINFFVSFVSNLPTLAVLVVILVVLIMIIRFVIKAAAGRRHRKKSSLSLNGTKAKAAPPAADLQEKISGPAESEKAKKPDDPDDGKN